MGRNISRKTEQQAFGQMKVKKAVIASPKPIDQRNPVVWQRGNIKLRASEVEALRALAGEKEMLAAKKTNTSIFPKTICAVDAFRLKHYSLVTESKVIRIKDGDVQIWYCISHSYLIKIILEETSSKKE